MQDKPLTAIWINREYQELIEKNRIGVHLFLLQQTHMMKGTLSHCPVADGCKWPEITLIVAAHPPPVQMDFNAATSVSLGQFAIPKF